MKRGFSLIELLVVLGVFVILASIFIPYTLQNRSVANRAKCANNLRAIRDGFYTYQSAFSYNFPSTHRDDSLANHWTSFTGIDDPSQVQGNDVTASLYLLVRSDLVTDLRTFICPSSRDTADRDAGKMTRGNFTGPGHLSYSYASPFSAVLEYRLNDVLPAQFAILADKNPGPISDAYPLASDPVWQQRLANSRNHRQAGQNVLYASGEVLFVPTAYSGVRQAEAPDEPGDNIYTALTPTPLIEGSERHDAPGVYGKEHGPAYRYDSVLVP